MKVKIHFCSTLAIRQWLVIIILDSTDIKYFHHHRIFHWKAALDADLSFKETDQNFT